jgi:hypothetical protein
VVVDYGEMTYADALAHSANCRATGEWFSELVRHDVIPFMEGDWFNYVCTFTEAPPKMDLRVNYGHDWVESFYEAGHAVTVTLTGSDGVTVKATAELVTEPKDYWGGEPGFQTMDTMWFDAEGNPLGNPPDIQPYDWVKRLTTAPQGTNRRSTGQLTLGRFCSRHCLGQWFSANRR